ncbi:hypothetical protein [Vagococcus intermedius]|uniref:DUF2812 domain-containing protein n=1 Tax=Vagococcus intermedius TaxID=2991418 RepID=A0AAF0I7I5_9ENTE|nr:hypothetical protein [Vagococcus intermedius]WEG73036.1 hypothetical protein OL234_08705 [Vagococcus intermedius]WEG75121.1 hypothetical protein OL235_08700 [Vagococcus intermedius]
MLRLSFSYRDIEKEEMFLNEALTKGWLFVKRVGGFYQFKKNDTVNQLIRIEVVQTADMPLLQENVEIITSRVIKNKGMTLVYYLIKADPIVVELRKLSREPHQYLDYYIWLRDRQTFIMYGCVIPLIVLISYWGTIVEKRTSLLNQLAIILLLTIVVGYFIISHKTKGKIKEYRMLSDDYSDQLTLRFIVKVPRLTEKECDELKIAMTYLGKWQYRMSDKNQSYFYVHANTNEVEIKNHLTEYLGTEEGIVVVSPMALFPLGYF